MKKVQLTYIFFLLFYAVSIHAKDLELRWRHVEFNNGYEIQLDTISQGIITKRSQENKLVIKNIFAGKYRVRIAALNKFSRPAGFSKWYEIEVGDSVENEILNVGQNQSEANTQAHTFDYWTLIPGVPQWSNQSWKSWLYWGFMSMELYFFNHEKESGNKLADKFSNDTLLLALLYNQADPLLGWYMHDLRTKDKRIYDKHQTNQKIHALLFMGSYLIHILDVYYLDTKTSLLFKGDATSSYLQFRVSFQD